MIEPKELIAKVVKARRRGTIGLGAGGEDKREIRERMRGDGLRKEDRNDARNTV